MIGVGLWEAGGNFGSIVGAFRMMEMAISIWRRGARGRDGQSGDAGGRRINL